MNTSDRLHLAAVMTATIGVAAFGVWISSPWSWEERAAAAETTTVGVDDRLRAELARTRAQLRTATRERNQARRAARRVWRPTVDHAIALASYAYDVPLRDMRTVAACESTFNPYAKNGQYLGLYQFGLPLWSGLAFRNFARTDPYAAALAAAKYVRDHGHWNPWECAAITGVGR